MEDLTRRGMLAATAATVWCWPAVDRPPLPGTASTFRLRPEREPDPTPSFKTGFIDHAPPMAYVHCPSIASLPGGRLFCCWYAGSREGGRDVGVWMAESDPAGTAGDTVVWGPPRLLVDRASATGELDRFIDKVGNPVLFTDAAGRLWLVYVSIAVGGWSGSSLNAKCSADGGATWSRSQRLTVSPFFNISELVRAAPVLLESGDVGLPVYHECIGKFPEMLWLRPEGDRLAVAKSRMAGGRSLLQPAVVPLGPRRAVAYLRNHSRRHRLVAQQTTDGGATWSTPAETPLANPDASVAAIRLSGGGVLVAFNNSDRGRDNLCLALSADGLQDWRLIATLDDEPDEKFAYPFLSGDAAGVVNLVYSWKMRRIRHVAMNEAWLLAQRPGRPLAEPRPAEPLP